MLSDLAKDRIRAEISHKVGYIHYYAKRLLKATVDKPDVIDDAKSALIATTGALALLRMLEELGGE